MAKNRRAQVDVAVGADTSGAKASVEDLKKSIVGIGDTGQKSTEKVEQATNKMVASIQRSTASLEAAGKGRAEFFESLAQQRGADMNVLAPYIAQLRAAEAAQAAANASLQRGAVVFNQYGLSAKQTAAALRQVPAQLTDIFVSLQGGQAPLTVLLQQGGQLKDIFGGIVPAAKALGGALLGLINPYTVAAAAIGGLAYAYNKGANESQAFEKAVITSGRAAGVTGGQLSDMAKAIERIGGGSQSKAAEVLTKMAASGQIGAVNMQRYAAAIVEFDRVGGGVAEKTIGAFEELAKAPLQASLKLNDAMNYLSRSTIDTIKSLEEQGRTVEAATVASDAYYASIRDQTPEIERNLGYMEKGWRAVKEAISGAVSAAAGLGRAASLNEDIAVTQTSIDRLRAAAANRGIANPREFVKSLGGQSFSEQADELQVVLDKLKASAETQKYVAGLTAEQAKNTREYGTYLKENEKYLANNVKLNKEITRITVDGLRFGESMEEIQRKIALARERSAKAGGGGARENRELEQQARLIDELSGVTADFSENLLRLQKIRESGRVTEERYQVLLRELLDKQPVFKELAKQQADAEKKRATALKEANDAQAKNLAGLDKQIEGNEKTLDGLREELIGITMGKQARAEAIAQRYEEAAAQAEQNAQLAYMGDFNEYEKLMKIAEGLRAVAAERRKISSATTMKEIEEANEKAAKKAQEDWEKASDQIGQSLADSLMQGGKSAAEYIRDLFRTMVLRPVIQAVVQPFANAVNGAINAGGSALTNYAGSALGMLTGTSGWSGLNIGGTVAAAGNYGAVYSGAAYGTGFGTQQSAMLAAQEAGMVSSAGSASMASYAGWVAAIAAGVYKANKDWDEGYRRDQARDVSQSAWGGGGLFGDLQPMGGLEETKADFFSMLGFSDKWADLLSGATAVSKLFGRAAPQITGSGIQGTIGAGDFTGQAYADIYEKGGLFRSSKSYQQFAELPDEINRFLDGAASGIFDKAKEYGEALGLPVDALAGITTELKEQIGSDAEANKKAIMESLGAYGDALVAGWAEAIAPLAFYGETTIQTIERVAGAIIATNDMLDLLGIAALDASIEGGKAAQALAEMFGGIEGIARSATAYYENFYSDGEKALTSARQVSEALDDVGLSLPQTRAEFRRLVEGLDLTTDAGRRQFAVLMGVAGAFAELTPLLDGVGNGLEEGIARLKDLEDGLADILGTMAKSIQETLSDLIDNLTRLQDFRTSLQDAATGYRLAGMQPTDRVAALRAQEATLFAQLGSAADPVAVAEKLQGVIIARIQEEAALRQAAEDDIYMTARLAREEQIKTLREQISGYEQLRRLAESINQFVGSLRSSDLSPLSYADQLAASRSLFDQTVAGVRSGDAFAQQNLTGNAQAFLNEARQYFGSSEAYADIFSQVTATLDELAAAGANVDPQIAALQDQLTQLEMMNDAQQRIIESNTEIAVALDRVDAALGERENQMAAAVQEQIALARQEIEEQRKINEALQAQIVQATAGYSSVNQNLLNLGLTVNEIASEIRLNRAVPQDSTTPANRV